MTRTRDLRPSSPKKGRPILARWSGALSALVAGMGLACGQESSSSSPVEFLIEPDPDRAPLGVQFTDLSTGDITSREWDFGDGAQSNLQNPFHVYELPGPYEISLTIQGPSGGPFQRGDSVEVEAPTLLGSFGADTPGGQGGAFLHVVNLASSGPGSLRAALETPGPRIVVFDVAGVIDLERTSIRITEPFLTVEGRSGPTPGITLIRGGISVRTHDVHINHLRIRPGDAGQLPGSGWEPDGLGVWGPDAQNILLENCSVSWAVDENFAVSSDDPPHNAPRRVTLRNCFITEALRASTHSEGDHSRGALIRGQEVAIEGCLFAHNSRRNPVFRAGATGIVVNNLIYDPESAAVHLSGGHISLVGNVLVHGLDTKGDLPLLQERGRAYLHDNLAFDRNGDMVEIADTERITVLTWPPFWRTHPYEPVPAAQVGIHILQNAGAWPDQRDPIDRRIVQQLLTRQGRVIDSQDEVGGYPP